MTDDSVRLALRLAVMAVRERYPFEILAWVLMPDHLHTICRLPDNDSAYSERWRQIKRHSQYLIGGNLRLWQKRFWEHTIRDEADFACHFDYLHFNPVKHGYVGQISDCGFLRFTVMSNRVFIRIIGVAAMRTFLLNTIKVMSDSRIRPMEN